MFAVLACVVWLMAEAKADIPFCQDPDMTEAEGSEAFGTAPKVMASWTEFS